MIIGGQINTPHRYGRGKWNGELLSLEPATAVPNIAAEIHTYINNNEPPSSIILTTIHEYESSIFIEHVPYSIGADIVSIAKKSENFIQLNAKTTDSAASALIR